MTLKTPFLSLLLCLGASAGWAADTDAMVYADFAATVPHVPLTECPAVVTAANADCHVATIDGRLHVLAFARTGARLLLEVHAEAGDRHAAAHGLGRLD